MPALLWRKIENRVLKKVCFSKYRIFRLYSFITFHMLSIDL